MPLATTLETVDGGSGADGAAGSYPLEQDGLKSQRTRAKMPRVEAGPVLAVYCVDGPRNDIQEFDIDSSRIISQTGEPSPHLYRLGDRQGNNGRLEAFCVITDPPLAEH